MKLKRSHDEVQRKRALYRALATHQPTYPAVFEGGSYHIPCTCGTNVDAGTELACLDDARDAYARHQAEQVELIGV